MIRLTLGVIAFLSAASAAAHEVIGPAGWPMDHVHPTANVEQADREGFAVFSISDQSDPARRAVIRDRFAAPIAAALRPGVPFGFDYLLHDFDKDGFQDVILVMKMDLGGEGPVGAPTYVYRFDGADWRKVLEGNALSLGIKETPGKPDEIMFTRPYPEPNARYVFVGGSYRLYEGME